MSRPGGSAQPKHEEIGASRTSGGGDLMIRYFGVEGMSIRNDSSQSPEESHKQRQDFDDGSNDLWSLYGKEAQIYDESRIKTLKGDMGGVLIFVRACFRSGQPEL
jgi:hypothetical protein